MRCGNCKADGVDVAHVRSCYQGKYSPVPDTPAGPQWPASEAQIKYVLGLQEERRLPDDYAVKDKTVLEAMEKDDVSAEITLLKTFPFKNPGAHREGKRYAMPQGRYAVREVPGSSEWTFWQVDKPTEGRWKGYTFIKMLVGAPGQYRKVEVGRERRRTVLDLIESNPEKAMLDYGHQAGVCGRCYSPLTNPDSLAAGIGPICAGKGF